MSHGERTRRSVLRLASVGAVGSAAGCLERLARSERLAPPPFDPPGTDWPMASFDAGNTASSAGAGPSSTPSQEWEARLSRDRAPGVALAGGTLCLSDVGQTVAYDLRRGERRWSAATGSAAAPAIAPRADVALVGSADGLTARALGDGTERWSTRTDGAVRSPVLDDGVGYVCDASGAVAAVDVADGGQQWQRDVGAEVVAQPATDGRAVAVQTPQRLVCLDAADGSRVWDAADESRSPPVVADGLVYSGRNVLTASDLATGDERWSRAVDPESPPAVAGQRLFLAVRGSTVLSLDAATGETQWSADPDLTWIPAQPVVGDGTVFVGDADRARDVVALDAADGSVGWRASLGEAIAGLAVVGERLLAQTGDAAVLSLAEP